MVAYYAGDRGRIPCLSHIHSFYVKRDIHIYRMTRVPALLFCSDEIRKSIARKARLRGTTHVVHNGTDVQHFRPSTSAERRMEARKEIGLPPDRIVIGQVGSLIGRKGADLLIRATARLIDEDRSVHLVLVGDGPQRDEFQALARELGIVSHITFAGNIADTAPWYRNIFDINVLASREEAFGIALIEGAASGLPLVAARTGGMKEVVDERVTGLAFRPEDVDDLARALGYLVDDEEARVRMGAAARSRAVEHFSVRTQVSRVQDVLTEVITEGTARSRKPVSGR